jgi:hypothetical protein
MSERTRDHDILNILAHETFADYNNKYRLTSGCNNETGRLNSASKGTRQNCIMSFSTFSYSSLVMRGSRVFESEGPGARGGDFFGFGVDLWLLGCRLFPFGSRALLLQWKLLPSSSASDYWSGAAATGIASTVGGIIVSEDLELLASSIHVVFILRG